jgi:BirA family biotin operon repressor/biotin-[acetyl-CoA-carboxylase] ligase
VSSESPYTDLDRPPLRELAVNKAVVRPGGLWRRVEVVTETGSTNADVADAARAGKGEGYVLVAEAQSAGRGRLGRTWTAPRRSGLFLSL